MTATIDFVSRQGRGECGEMFMQHTEISLTTEEAAKVRAVIVDVCGEEYLDRIEAAAKQNAIDGGYTEQGYAERRAAAPALVDLLFARDPDFMT